MSNMHISERLMFLLRVEEDARDAISLTPKEVRYGLQMALDEQRGAVVSAMQSAYATLDNIKRVAGLLAEKPDDASGERSPAMRELLDLTDKESEALQRLASEQGMSANQVMRAALRHYQMVTARARAGLRLAWLKPDDTIHVEPTGGCMGDE